MSLTNVAKKYAVSRASVVRFTREAIKREAAQVGEFQPAAVQAPADSVCLMPEDGFPASSGPKAHPVVGGKRL